MRSISVLSLLMILIMGSSYAGKKHKHKHHHKFDDVKKWEKIFEDPKRDEWQKPELVLKLLSLSENAKVADIGSATGYFPVRLARMLPKGRVWGVDIEPNLVNYLNQRAQKERITNLFSVLGTYSDPLIPEPVNLIIIVDTYHHIQKRVSYLKGLKKYLSPGGSIVIIDFKKGKLPFGPPDKMKLAPKSVQSEFKQAGLKLTAKNEELPYQYFLKFQSE